MPFAFPMAKRHDEHEPVVCRGHPLHEAALEGAADPAAGKAQLLRCQDDSLAEVAAALLERRGRRAGKDKIVRDVAELAVVGKK